MPIARTLDREPQPRLAVAQPLLAGDLLRDVLDQDHDAAHLAVDHVRHVGAGDVARPELEYSSRERKRVVSPA